MTGQPGGPAGPAGGAAEPPAPDGVPAAPAPRGGPDLPTPRTAEGREGLAAILRDPGRALIALDFDGTLSPIVADPAAARAHPQTVPVLRRLAGRAGTLAIITGRPAGDVVELGGFTGDDLGDLAAFQAVRDLRGSGHPGLTVCSGSAENTRLAGEADLVVDGPDGVLGLLAALADAVAADGDRP